MRLVKMKAWEAYRASLILCDHFFQAGDETYQMWLKHPLKKLLFKYLVLPFINVVFFQGFKLLETNTDSEMGFMFVMSRGHVAIGTDFFIHPEHQGKGVGFLITVHYARRAHQNGLKYLIGKISSENKPSLKLFTEKLHMTPFYDRIIFIPEANIPEWDAEYDRLALCRLPKKAVKGALQFVASQMFSRHFQQHAGGMGGVIEPLWLGAVHELRYEGELVGYASVSVTDRHPIIRVGFYEKWWGSDLESTFISFLARRLLSRRLLHNGLFGVQAGCYEHHVQLTNTLSGLGAEETKHSEVMVVGLLNQLAQLGEKDHALPASS